MWLAANLLNSLLLYAALLERKGKTLKNLITLFLCFMFAAPVHASRLTIPDIFEFLEVDGNSINSGMWTHADSIELAEGQHKIVLYYRDLVFDLDFGYERIIKSTPFTVTMTAQPGVNYHVVADESALSDKHGFANHPVVSIHSDRSGVNTLAEVPPAASEPGGAETGDSSVDVVSEKLRYWWFKADHETQKSFMSWIIDQQSQ